MTKSSRKCWKLRNKIPKWRWKFIFLHEKTMFLFKYGYRSKYTEYGTIFQKNHILPSNFFSSSNMFFIRLFLGKTWKKIGCHRACFLINCRERWTWFWYVCMHVCMYVCMKGSDPSPDTVSFMQLESRRAAPQASQPPSKASARTFNSTTRRPRSGNPQQTSGWRTFFCFSCFLRPDEEAVRRFAAFLLRIKSFRSAKAAHLCSFHASGRTAAILDVAINVIRKKGCVVQNEGIT